MRYTVEKFENGLLVERVTYDVPELPQPKAALVAEPNVIRGPWGDLIDRLP